jgi:hypothetical protein
MLHLFEFPLFTNGGVYGFCNSNILHGARRLLKVAHPSGLVPMEWNLPLHPTLVCYEFDPFVHLEELYADTFLSTSK